MDKYRDKYRIESTLSRYWDYGSSVLYFVTICSKNRIHYFGNVANSKMNLSEMGEIANVILSIIPSIGKKTGLMPLIKQI